MPTTLTPPDLDITHVPNDGDIGGGRRPPTDKRTGGNGDNENWDNEPQGKRGPRERLSRARVGILFVLGIVVMAFVGLITADMVTKSSGHFDPQTHAYVKAWRTMSVPSVLWLNTAVLLVSSFFAEVARRSMFREHELMEEWLGMGRPISRRATAWLSATLLFGLGFLAGQWKAWQQIAARMAYLRNNPSVKFFYLLTITHAVHLFVGIGILAAALIVVQRSRQLATRQVWVDSAVWYWHVMGLLWLSLFLLLEFGQ